MWIVSVCRQVTSNSDIASNYRLPAKSREWNVFSRVCESFCPRGATMWPLPLTHWISLYRPQCPLQICYLMYRTPSPHGIHWIPQIILWCITCWPLEASMAAKPFLFNILVYIYKHWWDLNLGSSVQHPEIFIKISNCRQRLIGSKIPWTLYQDLKWRTSTDR